MKTQEKSTGYVLMMDVSGSMSQSLEQVKINACSFISLSYKGDQFGVNQFSDDAKWVYPTGSDPAIVTVSASGNSPEIIAASEEISKVKIRNMTNIGSAIELGNKMIVQSDADLKAFILLSDGEHNKGTSPEMVLGENPPLYVVGLGPYLQRSNFDKLLKKNPHSNYYHRYSASEMMEVFNDIRALVPGVDLLANHTETYINRNIYPTELFVTTQTGEAQLSIVWSDKKFAYTSGDASGYLIQVFLINPDGNKLFPRPAREGDGYCIFNLSNITPGKWTVCCSYNNPVSCKCTVGGFQFGSTTAMEIDAPAVLKAGDPLSYQVAVKKDGKYMNDLQVEVRITQPAISVENALLKYAHEISALGDALETDGAADTSVSISKLQHLREQQFVNGDILGEKSFLQKPAYANGYYVGKVADTSQAGSYTLKIKVHYRDPETGVEGFICRSRSILVG